MEQVEVEEGKRVTSFRNRFFFFNDRALDCRVRLLLLLSYRQAENFWITGCVGDGVRGCEVPIDAWLLMPAGWLGRKLPRGN